MKEKVIRYIPGYCAFHMSSSCPCAHNESNGAMTVEEVREVPSTPRCTYCGGDDNGSGMCDMCDKHMNGRITGKGNKRT